MPLWLPKGTVLIEELEKLAKDTEFEAGYERVRTPHLARESMKNRWGNTHWAKVVLSGAVRRGELLRGKVSQGSTSPLKPCVKG